MGQRQGIAENKISIPWIYHGHRELCGADDFTYAVRRGELASHTVAVGHVAPSCNVEFLHLYRRSRVK